MAKNFTQIKKNLYISGAESFAQYLIEDHLFIVIGERHTSLKRIPLSERPLHSVVSERPLPSGVPCKLNPSKPIEDFIVEELKRSKYTRLLMEYPPNQKFKDVNYNSENMKAVRDVILAKRAVPKGLLNNLENRVSGIDIRAQYIPSYILYTDNVKKITLQIFFKTFWEPLINKNLFYFDESKYSKVDTNYLNQYIKSKKDNIQWFYNIVIPFI